MVLTSVFILLFVVSMVVLIPDLFRTKDFSKDSIIAIVTFALFIVLLMLGFRYGLKMVMVKTTSTLANYDGVLCIRFSARITFKDYLNLIFRLSFRKPVFLIYLGFTLLIIVNFITSGSRIALQGDIIFPGVFVLVVVVLLPVILFFQTKRIYASNKLFHEQVSYSLDNNVITIKGETFESSIQWSHFLKITETKNFFMLYQGKTNATLLDKNAMTLPDRDEFRKFIKSLPATELN